MNVFSLWVSYLVDDVDTVEIGEAKVDKDNVELTFYVHGNRRLTQRSL